MADVLASRELEVAIPTPIEGWINSGNRELIVDVLEDTAKQLLDGNRSTEVWPGSPELLFRFLLSDDLRVLDGLTFQHPETGVIEPVGRQVLAHSLRSALVAWEIASEAEPYLRPIRRHAYDRPAEYPNPSEVFDDTFAHDIFGKSQIGRHNPALLSEITLYRPKDKLAMYDHAQLGWAALKRLNENTPDGSVAIPLSVMKVALYHHALHPREFTTDIDHQIMTEQDQLDIAFIYGLMICALADSFDGTHTRGYMNHPSKRAFKFPAQSGRWKDVELWAGRMVTLPNAVSHESHEDYQQITDSFYSLLHREGTMTNQILQADYTPSGAL